MSISDVREDAVRRRAPIPAEQCGMARVASLLGDRWVLLILREAFYGVTRFDDMQADLEAPRAALSQRRNRLVTEGILERQPYREPGARQRNAYVLTPAGMDLWMVLLAMMEWGDTHRRDDPSPVSLSDRRNGQTVRIGLVNEDGEQVPLEDLVFDMRPAQEGPDIQ